MNSFQKKLVLRLCIYGILLLAVGCYTLFSLAGHGVPCFFYENYHIECISCGATRAFLSLIQLDLTGAMTSHPVFALALYPIAGIFALQDLALCIHSLCTGKDHCSLLQALTEGSPWEKKQVLPPRAALGKDL